MPDDLNKRGGQDRQRIDTSQKHELRDWSKSLGVTPQRLKEAVQAVGDRADKVREFLSRGGKSSGSQRDGSE
jgi:hypothetical protein